jgi:hypothetical protein
MDTIRVTYYKPMQVLDSTTPSEISVAINLNEQQRHLYNKMIIREIKLGDVLATTVLIKFLLEIGVFKTHCYFEAELLFDNSDPQYSPEVEWYKNSENGRINIHPEKEGVEDADDINDILISIAELVRHPEWVKSH